MKFECPESNLNSQKLSQNPTFATKFWSLSTCNVPGMDSLPGNNAYMLPGFPGQQISPLAEWFVTVIICPALAALHQFRFWTSHPWLLIFFARHHMHWCIPCNKWHVWHCTLRLHKNACSNKTWKNLDMSLTVLLFCKSDACKSSLRVIETPLSFNTYATCTAFCQILQNISVDSIIIE